MTAKERWRWKVYSAICKTMVNTVLHFKLGCARGKKTSCRAKKRRDAGRRRGERVVWRGGERERGGGEVKRERKNDRMQVWGPSLNALSIASRTHTQFEGKCICEKWLLAKSVRAMFILLTSLWYLHSVPFILPMLPYSLCRRCRAKRTLQKSLGFYSSPYFGVVELKCALVHYFGAVLCMEVCAIVL